MTREETLAVMSVLKAAYPGFYRDMKRSEAEDIVSLWEEMFRDDPAQVVGMAVKAHIAGDGNGYPPTIGAIRQAVAKLTRPKELDMSELEAWGLVRRAVQNGIYGAQKEFDALPPVVQQCVGSPSQLKEWALLDEDVVASVVASNFQRSYRARAAQAKEFLALPADVRSAMQQLGAGLQLKSLEG